MHWIWHEEGWMHKILFSGHDVSVKDHAGGMTVHLAAASVSLMGFLFLGRRLLRLRDIDESSLGSESPGSTVTGYILIATGLIAFSLPTPRFEETHPPHNYLGIILVNSIMAMAAGIIIVVALHFLLYRDTFNYWVILKCIQGALAGIVSIASGVDVYTPIMAFALAAGAAMLFYFIAQAIHLTPLEDYCNVIAIHFVCGLISSLTPPLLGSKENLGSSVSVHTMLVHFEWQCICCGVVVGLCLSTSLLLFLILCTCGILRNRRDRVNHKRAVTVCDNQSGCCFARLFKIKCKGTTYIKPGISGKRPEQRRSDGSLKRLQGNNDTRERHRETNALSREDVTNDQTNIENEQEEVMVTTQKPRFLYTVANVHEVVRFRDDTAQAGGDCEKVKQNFAMIEPTRKLSDEWTFLEQFSEKRNVGSRRRNSFHKLHKTRKYTNLHKRKSFTMLNKMSQNSPSSPDAGILLQSVDCMLYDAKFNDGFVTLKIPTEFEDNSDTCPGEYEQSSLSKT